MSRCRNPIPDICEQRDTGMARRCAAAMSIKAYVLVPAAVPPASVSRGVTVVMVVAAVLVPPACRAAAADIVWRPAAGGRLAVSVAVVLPAAVPAAVPATAVPRAQCDTHPGGATCKLADSLQRSSDRRLAHHYIAAAIAGRTGAASSGCDAAQTMTETPGKVSA